MSRETEVLKTLLEVSRLISSNYPIPKVIKRICGKLRKLLHTDDCSIMILNEKSRELAFSESSGLTRWEMKNIKFALGEGVAGWVAKHKKPVLIEDVNDDARFKRVVDQKRSMVSMIFPVSEPSSAGLLAWSMMPRSRMSLAQGSKLKE